MSWTRPEVPITSRIAYAAAHVVPVALADNTPGAPAVVDWDTTLAYRHELWSYGLGVADAMDTAQRGMGLDWAATQELIKRSGAEAAAVGGLLACGAGTDQLDLDALPEGRAGLDRVLDAYREQIEIVTGAGATVIMMASRALARIARTPDDYRYVYATLLSEVTVRSSCTGSGRCSTRRWPATGEVATSPAATDTFTDADPRPRRPGRRGEGLPAGRRPRDGAAGRTGASCRGRSGSTPATTSTIRS